MIERENMLTSTQLNKKATIKDAIYIKLLKQ